MRTLLNFMHRDGWSFHLLAEDCRTALSEWRPVESEEALLGMIAKMNRTHWMPVNRRYARFLTTIRSPRSFLAIKQNG